MRLARLVTGAVVAAAVVLLTAITPASAAPAVNYVALGDSYSSGVGTGSYLPDSGRCLRSTQSYPSLWVADHNVASFDFAACSGASTNDVLTKQLGGLNRSTTLVTITIGGNDAGFAVVMTNCVLETDENCHAAVAGGENIARTVLPGRLHTLFKAIRDAAPHARVVVLGYPRFYQLGGRCVIGLSEVKRADIDDGADVLDSVLHDAAMKFRGFTFVDVRGAFAPHEICSAGEWWLHSVDWVRVTDSYHPTVHGYSDGYLPTLESAVG